MSSLAWSGNLGIEGPRVNCYNIHHSRGKRSFSCRSRHTEDVSCPEIVELTFGFFVFFLAEQSFFMMHQSYFLWNSRAPLLTVQGLVILGDEISNALGIYVFLFIFLELEFYQHFVDSKFLSIND